MPLACLLALLLVVICVPSSGEADEAPPAGCFASAPGKTLEIEGSSDIKAWIGQRADGTWDACLRLVGCSWRVENASANLPPLQSYLVDALVHPKCNVRWVNSTPTSECEHSSELVTSFEKLASLISDSLGGGSDICAGSSIGALTNNVNVFSFGGGTWSRYWLSVDGWCIEGFVRLSDGASSLGIGKDCPANAARFASFATVLSPDRFSQSKTWIIGHAGGYVFGSSVDLTATPAGIGSASFVAGGLNETYVLSWLQSAANAAISNAGIDRTDDPLPSVSGAGDNSGRFLHWLAAASSRLSTIPFDASSGWDDPESRRARKWSALIDLSNEPALRGTHFRAEIARSP